MDLALCFAFPPFSRDRTRPYCSLHLFKLLQQEHLYSASYNVSRSLLGPESGTIIQECNNNSTEEIPGSELELDPSAAALQGKA